MHRSLRPLAARALALAALLLPAPARSEGPPVYVLEWGVGCT